MLNSHAQSSVCLQWVRSIIFYNFTGDQHARGDLRRAMIAAHANHVGFKMKRHSTENRDASDGE